MAEKNKGGRPEKTLDDDQMRQLETLAAALSIEQISEYFGMSKVTFYKIMERDQDVNERYKRGKAKAIAGVAGNLINQARNGNVAAAIFYLKTQAGWKETVTQEISGPDGKPIQVSRIELVPMESGDDTT